MKLEYLPDGSNDCPIIRIFDFDLVEAESLVEELEKLTVDVFSTLPLHHLPFVESIGDCRLTAVVGDRAEGIDMVTVLPDANSFVWVGSQNEWRGIIELITPLETLMSPHHYQWLTDDFGVQIFFSQVGLW